MNNAESFPTGSDAGPGKVKKQRKRFGFLDVLGMLLFAAGLVLGGKVVYDVFLSNSEADSSAQQAYSQVEKEWSKPVMTVTGVRSPDTVPVVKASQHGEVLGILHIPVLGEDYRAPIKEGSDESVLKTGAAGRYVDTANIGDIGNAGIAGHRLTRGNPFLHIDKVEVGMNIVVETKEAWLVYEVTGTEIVKPDEVDVLLPVPRSPGVNPTERMMTLTTCHPIWSDKERWITYTKLTGWTPRSEGVPAELKDVKQADTISNNEVPLSTEG